MARLTLIDRDNQTYATESVNISTSVQGMFLVEVNFPYQVWPTDVRPQPSSVVGWDAVVTVEDGTYSGIINSANSTGLVLEVEHS